MKPDHIIIPAKPKQGQKTGPKPIYGEPTVTVAFRVPASRVAAIKVAIQNLLKQWRVK